MIVKLPDASSNPRPVFEALLRDLVGKCRDNLRSWMNLFAREPPPAEPVPSEPEAPEPPIIRHELFRNDEARLYVDVNPGVGFAVVVAARWPGKVQPWLSYDEMRRIVRQIDDIVKQQKLHELNEMFWDAYQRGMDKP